MARKRKNFQLDNKKKKKKKKKPRGDVVATPVAISSSSSPSSSPRYWKHFLHYQRQFSQLCPHTKVANQASCQFTLPSLNDETYREYYSALKSRELKLVYQNYINTYLSTTKFTHLVLEQRLLMLEWIINLGFVRYETTFLAVTLMDSFLARGYFKHQRYLQLLGIACLMLASRIEENQEENEMVGRPEFRVENKKYYTSEIIAMEWLVQKVLNFQCSVPTIYNFLCIYLKAVNADAELEMTTMNLALITLGNHGRLCYPPSTVAAAIVILAASFHSNQESSCQHLSTMTDDVQSCTRTLKKWLQDYYTRY